MPGYETRCYDSISKEFNLAFLLSPLLGLGSFLKAATPQPTAIFTEQLPILTLEPRAALREDAKSGKVAASTSPGVYSRGRVIHSNRMGRAPST